MCAGRISPSIARHQAGREELLRASVQPPFCSLCVCSVLWEQRRRNHSAALFCPLPAAWWMEKPRSISAPGAQTLGCSTSCGWESQGQAGRAAGADGHSPFHPLLTALSGRVQIISGHHSWVWVLHCVSTQSGLFLCDVCPKTGTPVHQACCTAMEAVAGRLFGGWIFGIWVHFVDCHVKDVTWRTMVWSCWSAVSQHGFAFF